MLSIRPATPDDNARIDELFTQARAFMAQNGNPLSAVMIIHKQIQAVVK